MRALRLTSYDGPNALELVDDVPEPVGDAASVVVDVRAIGVNFPDLVSTKGQYQHKPPLPFVPGSEIAGVVIEAPQNSPLQPGDRASAFVWGGGYAERARVPINALSPVPDGADYAAAAAMVINYHTVYFALARRGQLKSGETLVVLGAAGGIGTAAVEVGKGLGARVIGGVAAEEQRATAVTAGADEVIVLSEGFSSQLREITDGRGVDVVLDPLGDWLFTEATRGMAPEGRILVIGFAAGDIPTVKVNRLLLRNISAVGVGWGAFLDIDSALMASAAAALNEMFTAGFLRPQISITSGFDAIPNELHRLERHEILGKAVVMLDANKS